MEYKTKTYTITEIYNYIFDTYPDSVIHTTHPHGVKLPEQYMLNMCYNFFRYEVLKWCGCGDLEQTETVVKNYLSCANSYDDSDDDLAIKKEQLEELFGCSDISENDLLMCLVYTLDSCELIEHAYSIYSSYLTSLGEMCLTVLQLKNSNT